MQGGYHRRFRGQTRLAVRTDLAMGWKQLAKTAPPTAVGRPVARVRDGSLLAGLER